MPGIRNRRLFVLGTAALLLSVAQPANATPTTAPTRTAASTAAGTDRDWLQFGGDPAHTGDNTSESVLGATSVSRLTSAFTATLPGIADAPPVYRSGVVTSSGTRNLLFVHTRDGWTTALDATSGTAIWSHQVSAGSCRINNGSTTCYTTSAAAVDPSGAFVYSYGLDGRVHKYASGTGAETTTGGWPELATTKGFDEKGSSDLSIATSHGITYLYAANGGYPGDRGDYQGHVTTINLATGSQHVFNTLCSDQTVHFASRTSPDCSQVQSAVWARGGVVYDSATDTVWMSSGNGNFSPSSHDWGDTVLAVHPDGTGVNGGPLDSYTPTNYQALQDADLDLGSTAPALVKAPAGSSVSDLAVQSGKDANLRLLDMADPSGAGGPGHIGGQLQILAVPQGGTVLTQPTSWANPGDGSSWVFVANNSGLSGLRITSSGGRPSMSVAWKTTTAGTSPVMAGNVLYYLTDGGVQALDPTTGNTLWRDPSGSVGLHWQSAIVVNGYLYYPDGSGRLHAFTVPTLPAHTGPIVGIAARCLDDDHAGTANGTRIQLWTCNGSVAQRWTAGSDGTIRVLGKCLDDRHSGTANGNPIQLYTCNGGLAQRWTVGSSGSLRVLGKCLDDQHSGTADGNTVQLYTCNGTAAQRWQLP